MTQKLNPVSVCSALFWSVEITVYVAVNEAVNGVVYGALYEIVVETVNSAVYEALRNQPTHPNLHLLVAEIQQVRRDTL